MRLHAAGGLHQMLPDDAAEHLLIPLLAVNNWTLERVWELRDELCRVGLMDLDAVARLSEEKVAARLAWAGHTRGKFMNMLQ